MVTQLQGYGSQVLEPSSQSKHSFCCQFTSHLDCTQEETCRALWLTSVILATQEAKSRRTAVWSQSEQILHKTLSRKNPAPKRRSDGVAQVVKHLLCHCMYVFLTFLSSQISMVGSHHGWDPEFKPQGYPKKKRRNTILAEIKRNTVTQQQTKKFSEKNLILTVAPALPLGIFQATMWKMELFHYIFLSTCYFELSQLGHMGPNYTQFSLDMFKTS
jgi:hypothetical protein